MTGTALTVNAEESQPKLLVAEYICTENTLICGGGYFHDNDGFFKLGEEELAKWRETGNYSVTKIECDVDLTDFSGLCGDFEGEYLQFGKKDADGNITERKVVHLDKENNKIELAYTLGADWCYTLSDGYTMSFDQSDPELRINVYDPSGKKTTTSLTYTGDGKWWFSGGTSMGGDNVGYVLWLSARYGDEEDNYEFGDVSYDYEVYAIQKNDSLKLLDKNDEPVYGYGYRGGNSNCVMYGHQTAPTPLGCWLYSTDDNKVYQVGNALTMPGGGQLSDLSLGGKLYGTKVVIKSNDELYALVDVSENPSGFGGAFITKNALSKAYKYMSTNDGKIYRVKTEDDKQGYIDSNGKELAIFDVAGDFHGDFAPVVKDGKAYLIDRNMNKVSEAIDGESVFAFSDGLYSVTVNGEEKFMTYAAKPTASEPTSEPTNPTEPTSEPTSKPEDTKNPETGIPGIAAAFGTLALAAGTVIVAKKRK